MITLEEDRFTSDLLLEEFAEKWFILALDCQVPLEISRSR